MLVDALDHLVLAVPHLASAAERFERLGFVLSPPVAHPGMGTELRALFLGRGPAHAYIELLAVRDEAEARRIPGRDAEFEALARGGGLSRIFLSTNRLAEALERLQAAGLTAAPTHVRRADGSPVASTVAVPARSRLGAAVGLIEYASPAERRWESRQANGLFAHRFPAKRIDHIAIIVDDVDAAARAWDELLGVPVRGEVRTPAMVIRQLDAGNAVIELIAASGPESPVALRPRGLVSMVAVEVPDVDEAVRIARERGFTITDPSQGPLPETRTATIPAGELAGMALQLLEYRR